MNRPATNDAAEAAVLDGADVAVEEQAGAEQPETGDGSPNAGANINPEEAERIASQRSERASNAALKSYFQQQGMSPEEATQAIAEYREQKAAQKQQQEASLVQAQQQAQQLQQQLEQVAQVANNRLIRAEAKLQAITMQVRPERVEHLIRLADLTKVKLDDNGNPDAAAIKEALDAVLTEVPELKGTEHKAPGFKIGGPGQDQQSTTQEKLAEIFGNKRKG